MIILFDKKGEPISPASIMQSISNFGWSYNLTVQKVINNSANQINGRIFRENVATLMPNFKMTRSGLFKGIKFSNGTVTDPNNLISTCWQAIGSDAKRLKMLLGQQNISKRGRLLVEIPSSVKQAVAVDLWKMFKKLIPICTGKATLLGLVPASKVLFSIFPEIALPIDTKQWPKVFKTPDYGEIILRMIEEIALWEDQIGQPLELCDPFKDATLPSVYNVMAMKARP
jgi:hypothetical protein